MYGCCSVMIELLRPGVAGDGAAREAAVALSTIPWLWMGRGKVTAAVVPEEVTAITVMIEVSVLVKIMMQRLVKTQPPLPRLK